ncbi:MAG: hypothetical protein ACLS29_07645 [Prevotellamassilia sp.]
MRQTKTPATGQSLTELAAIGDDQVVRPASKGYYRLRNYQDLYYRAAYYYLKQGTDAQTPDIFTSSRRSYAVAVYGRKEVYLRG